MKRDHIEVLKEKVARLSAGDTVIEYGASHTGRLLADFVKQGGNDVRVLQIEPDRAKFEEAFDRARDLEKLEVADHVPADLKRVQIIFTEKLRPIQKEIEELQGLIEGERPLLMLPESRPVLPSLMESLKYDFKNGTRQSKEFWVAREKNEEEKYKATSGTVIGLSLAAGLAVLALVLYIAFKRTKMKK